MSQVAAGESVVMASGHFTVVYREIGRLFGAGTVSGLSEGQLLDRFVAGRDDGAFEAIVAKHGPMVLSVCRDHLRDPNDVDDAFQATFLVLVRRAGSLRQRDGLGNWLYGVARRVAKRAQIEAARRRGREGLGQEPADESRPDPSDFELRPMIHDEVGRLPDSYRAAVVLCFFEGQTHEEAADRLGWPVGTVKGRLARAKDLLRDRLSRRGVSLPAGLLAATLARSAEAAVPPGLVASTVSASSSLAGTIPLSALGTSPGAIALTEGVLRTMIVTRWKVATSSIVALGVLSGSGVLAYQFGGGGIGPAPAPPAQTPSGVAVVKDLPVQSANAQSRIKLAEEALVLFQKRIVANEATDSSPELLNWSRRLYEAKVDAGVPRAEAAKPYLDALQKVEDASKKLFEKGEATALDVLNIRFLRLQTLAAVNAPSSAVPPISNAAPGGGMGAMMVGMGGAGPPGGGMMAARGGAFPPGGGGGFGGDANDGGARHHARKEHPSDIERNKAIEQTLEIPLSMNFGEETPLVDVLKYIKSSVTSQNTKNKTIPIYVDPVGLQEAEKTIASPVTMEIDDVPLRTTLRLMLHQINLDYRVRDGMLYISAESTLNEEDEAALVQAQQEESRGLMRRGIGGMGGGMGGIGGGGMAGPGGMRMPGTPVPSNKPPTPSGNRPGGLQ